MNLLKQTALILGLVSLSIGGWTLYKNWRSRLAILFSLTCFCIAIWALSFVSDVTLSGRLSRDIHWFFNIWLAPIGVNVLAQISGTQDRLSVWIWRVSLVGASLLSAMVALTLGSSDGFWSLVKFWPTWILVQYLLVVYYDLILGRPTGVEFISPSKRKLLYAGLGVSMAICSLDHIPWLGYTVPAFGNLLFAVYLGFASQLFTPQRLLGMEALISRFFAIVILSLVITGYFALLYQYMSESFGLFLLNSFLISFAVLVLWNPLITFFRFIGRKIFSSKGSVKKKQIEQFQIELAEVTSLESLAELIKKYFSVWMRADHTGFIYQKDDLNLPAEVREFFLKAKNNNDIPILHRELLRMEREQVLTAVRRDALDLLIGFLNRKECDIIFPIFDANQLRALVLASVQTSVDEWSVSLGYYTRVFKTLQEIPNVLNRLTQIEKEKEQDRLILMGEMAAGLAHEVRNPLGAIRGAAELLDEKTPWSKVIQEEVGRLNRLVSQFLDFANSPQEKPEEVDLVELVNSSVHHLKPMIPQNIDFKILPESKNIIAQVVPDHIQQVVINLVQNSIKALEGVAQPTIEIRIFKTGFSVKDNGIGIDVEKLNRIFQPFYTSFKDGSGLGLSICQRLVNFNGGKMTVHSQKGHGTEMVVDLCAIK